MDSILLTERRCEAIENIGFLCRNDYVETEVLQAHIEFSESKTRDLLKELFDYGYLDREKHGEGTDWQYAYRRSFKWSVLMMRLDSFREELFRAADRDKQSIAMLHPCINQLWSESGNALYQEQLRAG